MSLSSNLPFSSPPANASELAAQKSALRKYARKQLSQINPEERIRHSQDAQALLQKQSVWQEARTILLYAPLPDEIDLWPLLPLALKTTGKAVFLPKYQSSRDSYEIRQVFNLESDIVSGFYGIREPALSCPSPSLKSLDLILVPGVAFSRDGCRLGRGKGYYDRLLININGRKCGVAFDSQILEKIPASSTDIPCDCILTPTRWLVAGPGRS